jgi:hypothetical protein
MRDYEKIVHECYDPLIKQYEYQFAKYDGDEFFLIGDGFALYVFVDRRDRRADVWYVSLDSSGNIKTHTLMYIQKQRYKQEDFALYGDPKDIDGRIRSDMIVASAGLLNHCQDILSGDTNWLKNYADTGTYSRHIARFLKLYFESQGYYVAPVPDSYN